jgi:hypothetical protein
VDEIGELELQVRDFVRNPSSLGYNAMSSRRFGSAKFIAYPQDHEPRHVHGFTGEIEVVVDLQDDGTVRLADRADAIRPSHAKRSDVRKVLNVAARHFAELVELWEKMHA